MHDAAWYDRELKGVSAIIIMLILFMNDDKVFTQWVANVDCVRKLSPETCSARQNQINAVNFAKRSILLAAKKSEDFLYDRIRGDTESKSRTIRSLQ